MKKFFIKHREIIVYILVGLLTTIVSYGVRFAVLYGGAALFGIDLDLENSTGWQAVTLRAAAPTIGWIAAMLFAFYPNKIWVFRNREKEPKKVFAQFLRFVGMRIGTCLVDMGIAALFPILLAACGYQTFHFIIDVDADIVTTGVSIVVTTILNYIFSKFIVFKNKKEE